MGEELIEGGASTDTVASDELFSPAFWPDYIADNPFMLFFMRYIGLPLLFVWLVYAYISTIKFAFNTRLFMQRFKKNREEGEFETKH